VDVGERRLQPVCRVASTVPMTGTRRVSGMHWCEALESSVIAVLDDEHWAQNG